MGRRTKTAAPEPAAETQPVSPPSQGVRVVFVRDHQHAGVQYHAGDEQTFDVATVQLLRRFGGVAPD